MSNRSSDSQHETIYLSTAEAAERMAVSEETVRDLCRRGLLPGAFQEWDNGPWRIPADAVNAWKQQHAPTEQEEKPESKSLDTAPVEHQPAASSAELPATPFWQKVVAIGAIVAILGGIAEILTGSLGVLEWIKPHFATAIPLSFDPASEDEILIVIASFHHSEGVPDTEIHNEIRRAIREAAEEVNFSNLRVEVEPTRLAADDQARAEKLGQRYNASIVIWGADTGIRVTVSYLNLKQPDLDPAELQISETERTQLINPSAYASFVTQDLPGQLAFLSLFAIGQSYYIEENYEEAIAVIEAAVSSLTSDGNLPEGVAEAHFRLGWLYQGQMLDDEQAIAAYSKAIELDPTMVAAYSNRAFAYFFQSFSDFDQNDVNAAFADFEKVIELAPDSARAYESRGMMRIAQIVAQSYPSTAILSPDILDAALADLGRAIELDPDYVSPYVNRGDVYYLMGNSDAALANFNRAIELDPDNADVYQRRGNVHRSLDELDGALADFDKAIELDPDNAAFYYDRGLVHFEQDDLDAAIADFSEGITLESELSALYDDQDTERRSLSNLDETTYRLHVQWGFSGLTLEEAYYTRGSCLGIQGKLSESIADFNEAIRLNPNYAEAYSNRGAVRYQQGKLVSALADFNEAIELDRDYAEAYWRRGVALRRFSEPDEALADFRTYLELRPNADNRAQIEEWIAELEVELSDQ